MQFKPLLTGVNLTALLLAGTVTVSDPVAKLNEVIGTLVPAKLIVSIVIGKSGTGSYNYLAPRYVK